jgi:hypothetical protein
VLPETPFEKLLREVRENRAAGVAEESRQVKAIRPVPGCAERCMRLRGGEDHATNHVAAGPHTYHSKPVPNREPLSQFSPGFNLSANRAL